MKEALRKVFSSQAAPIIVVFLALSLIAVWSWRSAIDVHEANKQSARTEKVMDVTNSISDRLETYEKVLLGSSGFVNASDNISPEQWATYFNSTNIKENYPGTLGFGYAEMTNPQDLERFLQQYAAQKPGGFRIYPEGNRERYGAIVLLEPQTEENKSAIGYDMYSEAVRSEAMQKAASTDQSVISASVNLIQDQNSGKIEPGFLMFTPVYKANNSGQESIENVKGFAYIPFRSETFFTVLESEIDREGLAIEITDRATEEPTKLYSSKDFESGFGEDTSTTTVPLNVYGTDWEIKFLFDESSLLSPSEDSRPALIATIGIFFGIILTVMVWLLLRARNYDLATQKDKEVNRAKDSLLSITSHQLRTPATGVKQYLGIVLQGFTGDITPAQRAMLEKANNSNERQLRTINEVLHLAKIESGRIVLAKSKVDLSKLIHDIVLEVGSEVIEHNHSLKVTGVKKPVYILADEHMLRMAVENLVTNAIKYTPNGGKIKVRLKASRNFVDIEVQDNGIGVASEDRGALYKQFVRLHNPQTRQVSGTGIGLYLAKELVELHHGKISLVSAPNKGSTFTITLPRQSVKNLTDDS